MKKTTFKLIAMMALGCAVGAEATPSSVAQANCAQMKSKSRMSCVTTTDGGVVS